MNHALAHCQACESARLEGIFELQSVPVHSCLMVRTREQALAFPRGALDLAICLDCGFIQNRAYEASLQSYSPEYEETQAFSGTFRAFQTRLCHDQVARYALADKLVLEIGCGKGEFVTELCEISGGRGIGIDPGYRPERNTSDAASRIDFRTEFYTVDHASLAADYVACRHTLEHIGPVREFVNTVRRSLEGRAGAVVFFELPAAERVLTERAFWDMYYEHCSYFTLGSLARLFRRERFQVLDLYTGYDAQYLMIEARPVDTQDEAQRGRRFKAEDDLDATIQAAREFRETIGSKLAALRAELQAAAMKGPVALWGSGSKAVSYLTTLDVTDEVAAVVDINPHKHGKFMAGTAHEILPPSALVALQPASVIVMNPIYLDEIRSDLEGLGLAPEVWAL
ncbi:MAG: class I SAM-dependent methyltransferase [Planctomycetota bacterium]